MKKLKIMYVGEEYVAWEYGDESGFHYGGIKDSIADFINELIRRYTR